MITTVTFFFVLRYRKSPTQTALVDPPALNDPVLTVPQESREGYCEKLYDTACSRRGRVVDVTGVVQSDAKGEIEALRLYEKIIHDHPSFTSDQVDDELVKMIYTPRRRQRLDSVFKWVLAAMERYIQNQPVTVFSEKIKKELLDRIRTTKLELPPPASIYANELDLFTKQDVYYERTSPALGTIRIGGAYVLTARSWFNRVFTFAHELAHAIDPCEVKQLKISAYDRLSACLVKDNVIRPRKKETQCGDNDQLPEAFADWVAVNITAEALNEYSAKFKSFQDVANAIVNSVRDLCDQENWQEQNLQTYPSPKTRIGVLFAQAPAVQKILGCQARIVSSYCGWEGE